MASLEDIEKMWADDSVINRTQLGEEAAKTPKLHAKYYALYIRELMLLRQQEAVISRLNRDLFMFYTDMMTPAELKAKDWVSFNHKVLKPDAQRFIEGDERMIKEKIKYALIDEKCSFIKSILDCIKSRGWEIKHIIDWMRFESGD